MSGGTYLRGEDGSLYFIRDEVLDACKVEGEQLDRAEGLIASDGDNEVEGFAFTAAVAPTLVPIKYISAPQLSLKPDQLRTAQSTLMCSTWP